MNPITGKYEHNEALCRARFAASGLEVDAGPDVPAPDEVGDNDLAAPGRSATNAQKQSLGCEARLMAAESALERAIALEEWQGSSPRSPLEMELYSGVVQHWRAVIADEGHMFSGGSPVRNGVSDSSYCVRCGAVRTGRFHDFTDARESTSVTEHAHASVSRLVHLNEEPKAVGVRAFESHRGDAQDF